LLGAHLKPRAGIALWPIGKEIVPREFFTAPRRVGTV
jgi:uncharacterized membrane protein YccF (DUF307 family)